LRTWKSPTLCSAIAGSGPRIARGSTGPSDSARTGETFPSAFGSARFIHPSLVPFNPGVPDSM